MTDLTIQAAAARRAAEAHARDAMGRPAARAAALLPDPEIDAAWLVLVRDGADEWAMLVARAAVIEDSLDADDFRRNEAARRRSPARRAPALRRFEVRARDGRWLGAIHARTSREARAQARRVGLLRGWPAAVVIRPARRPEGGAP